jgi:hypothetical protein
MEPLSRPRPPISLLLPLLLFVVFIPTATLAACPNLCSGHGTCGPEDNCICHSGYRGGDCSSRTCPFGRSWFSKAFPNGTAHMNEECSNRGICERETGECACKSGYEGAACERASCPSSCSGHGQCVTMKAVGLENGVSYSNWDKVSSTMCRCDWGYSGDDCSLRLCPKGDDPETTGQTYRSYLLTVDSTSGHLDGTVRVFFHGFSAVLNAHGSKETSASCQAALRSLENIDTLTCTQGSVSSSTGGASYNITVTAWPTHPLQNNLYAHDGAPPATDFYCDTARAFSSGNVTCALTADTRTNLFEYTPCSSRGACDYTSGLCACATGYEGAACSTRSTMVHAPCFSADISVHSTCPTFTGSALEVKSTRAAGTAFTFFDGISNGETLFDIVGDGKFTTYKTGFIIRGGGETIESGGMRVKNTGVTIDNIGMHVTDGGAVVTSSGTTPPLDATSTAAGTSFGGSAMEVKNTRASNANSNLMTAKVGGSTTVFSVRGDGLVRVHAGGLHVPLSGGTVTAGGLKVRDGATIHTTGLQVVAGGATVLTGGLNVDQGGSTIVDTGVATTIGTARSSHASFTGTNGVLFVKSTRAGSSAFNLLEALANDATTSLKVDGLGKTTLRGGLKINAVGTTITASGLQTYSGATVVSGGFQIPVAGGTISTSGLHVVSGGSSVVTAAQTLTPLTVHSTHTAMTSAVVSIQSLKTTSLSSAYFLELVADSATMLTVDHQGDVVSSAVTDSTSSTTGAVRSSGGLGVASRLYVGGVFKVDSTQESVSSTSGSITVRGGVGVAKDVYVGGALLVTSGTSVQPHLITGDTTVKTHSQASASDTATFTVQRARGSEGLPAAVHSGDYLGEFNFKGFDGATYVPGASIRGVNENAGTPVSANQAGGKVVFATTPGDSQATADCFHVDMNGMLKVLKDTQSNTSTSGALQTLGGLSVAKSLYVGEKLVSIVNDDQTAPITASLAMTHDVGSTTGAVGMGTSLTAYLENSNREVIKSFGFEHKLSTATGGSEVSLFNYQVVHGGTVAPRLTGTGIDTASIVSLTPTTQSTSAATGSFVNQGGAGIAKSIYAGGQLIAAVDAAGANSVLDVVVLEHTKSDGGPAQNMGVGMVAAMESADGNLNEVGSIDFKVSSTNLAAAGRSGEMTLKTAQGNSLFDAMKVSSVRTIFGSPTDPTSTSSGSLRLQGGLGIGKALYSGGFVYTIVDDATNAGITNVVSLSHQVSNTPQNNIGVGIEFDVETSSAVTKSGILESILTDVTGGGEDASLKLRLLESGTMGDAWTLTASGITYADGLHVVGSSALNGNVVLGNDQGDSGGSVRVNAVLQGAYAITFEGGPADAHELLLGVDDPTGTRAQLLPDATGHVITTGNLADIVDTGTLEALTVSGATTFNGDIVLGSDNTDTITFTGILGGALTPIVFEPDSNTMTLAIVNPTAGRTATLPDAAGDIITTGNLHQIVSCNTLTGLTVAGATALSGSATTIGASKGQVVTVKGSLAVGSVTSAHMVFEGATANGFETKVTVPSTVSGEKTVQLPDATGTIVTTGNLQLLTELLSMTTVTVSGTTSFTTTVNLGDADADTITVNQRILGGGTPLEFVGASDASKTTTLGVDTLDADRNITIPDSTGTVITTGNLNQIVLTGTLTDLTVAGALGTQAQTTIGDAAADQVTFNGAIQGTTSPMMFTRGGQKLNLGLAGPTADRTVTFPDASGTVITTANMNTLITSTNTLDSLTVDGTTTLDGAVAVGNGAADLVTLTAAILPFSSNNYLAFEGSAASYMMTLAAVLTSSSSNNIAIPDAGGTVITDANADDLTDLPSMTTLTVSGAVELDGTLSIGDAQADLLTIKSRILKGTPFEFKRQSSDTYKMSMAFESAGANTACKIVLPATTGTILTTLNPTAATAIGTLSGGLTVSGATALNGNVVIGDDAATDQLTIAGKITGDIKLEGTTGSAAVTTVSLVDPTGARTVTIPNDANGNIITTGNLADIVQMGTVSAMTLTGDATLNGDVALGTSVSVLGTIQGATPIRFKIPGGARRYNIAVTDPTGDRTLTIPNVDGTVVTTANLALITQTGTLNALTVTNGLTSSQGHPPVISNKGAGSISSAAVTVNKPAGSLTSGSLVTAAGACDSFTFTNSLMTSASTVMTIVRSYTGYGTGTWDNSKGLPRANLKETGTATTRTLQICNYGTTALNGVVVVDFALVSV